MTRPKHPRIHRSADPESTSVLRESYQSRERLRVLLEDADANNALLAEILQLRAELESNPEDDPMHVAARQRLDLIAGKPYRAWVSLRTRFDSLLRTAGHELILVFLPQFTILLILLFNLAAFFILLWLFSAL